MEPKPEARSVTMGYIEEEDLPAEAREARAQALAPSESMRKAAERPLATQPGVASLQIERAKGTAAEVGRHLRAARAAGKKPDDVRVSRLLLEEALAWERAGELVRAGELFEEAMKAGPDLVPAIQGARRIAWGLREGEGGARPRTTQPLVKKDARKEPSIASILVLLEREGRLSQSENQRADLLVERGRLLEAEGTRNDEEILDAYRNALTLRPSHAEAMKALEGALFRATLDGKGKSKGSSEQIAALEMELALHHGRIAAAYGTDPELVASYLATRAGILEKRGDDVGAEEAYAAALIADGRVGPVREAYKRLLARRGAWGKLRDVVAEEAGREHDMARSVRLLYEGARFSLERLGDAAQAVTLLEHAWSRAPSDPAVDARVLEELVRLLEERGDAKATADARAALLDHIQEPAIRAIELRRLAADHEAAEAPDRAIAAYDEARAIEPLHVPTQLALDRLYKRLQRHHDRVRLWLDEAAKAKEPSRRAAAYVRAAHVAEDDLQRVDDALEYLRAAWVSDTGNVDALDELTRILQPPVEMRQGLGSNDGRTARALIDLYLHAAQVASDPSRKIAFLEKVAALHEDALGDPGRAAEAYAKVLEIDPRRRFALLALQRAHERSGNFRGLAEAIETEADQTNDTALASSLRLRAAETWAARANDPDRGIALVRKVLEKTPNDPAALRALLKANEAADRPEEIVAALKRMIAVSRPDEALSLWLDVAEIQRRRLGRIDEAIVSWRAALAIDPTHPVATRELTHGLRTRGLWRELAELHEAIGAALTGKDAHGAGLAYVRAAEKWEGRLGDDEKAQKAYARALEIRPKDLSAWEGLARLAERRGALKELEAAYELRIANAESNASRVQLKLALGELLVRRGDANDQAAATLEGVVNEAPSIHALRLLEGIYRRTGNDGALAKTLTSIAQIVRDPLAKRGALWDLVRLQEVRGSSSPPIAGYLLIYELDPSDEAALNGIVRLANIRLRADMMAEKPSDGLPNVRGLLAFALRRQAAMTTEATTRFSLELRLADLLEDSLEKKEVAEALSLYRSALAHDKDSPTAIGGVRRLGNAVGDLAAQLEGEERAAAIAPDTATKVTHLMRAAELARKGGGVETAIAHATAALKTDPDSAEAATLVSDLLLGKGDARKLVDVFMEAASTAKRPDRIVALARGGAEVARTQLENIPVAIALLAQAREADPKDANVLVAIGDLYRTQRAWADAATAYQEVTAQHHVGAPVRVHAHKALSELYEGPLDDGERALEELRAVTRLAPDDVMVQRRLATVLFDQGDWEGAEQALVALVKSPALPTDERADVLLQLADIRLSQEDKTGAEEALREAVKLDSELTGLPWLRLEGFHRDHGEGERSLAGALNELIIAPNANPRWLIRLGQIEVHTLGRPNEGLTHLRMAMTTLPHDPEAQLAYAEALLAVGAIDEAAKTVRDIVARDPSNGAALDAAERAYSALQRRDEALVIAEIRAYFGFTGEAATFRARRLPPSPPRPQSLEDMVISSHVLPHDGKGPVLEVVTALSDQLAKVLPPDLGALGLSTRDRLTNRSPHAWRSIVDRAAAAMGVQEVDLYVHDAREQRILVENTDPPAVVVPTSLKALPELEVAFAISRLVAKVAMKTYLLDKLRPEQLEDLVYAAVAPFGGVSARARIDEVDDLSKRVQKAIARKTRRALEEVAPRLRVFDPIRFARAVEQGAIRAAYLVIGDLTSALDHLRRYEDIPPEKIAAEGTTTGELIRFALSPDGATLRKRIGSNWG